MPAWGSNLRAATRCLANPGSLASVESSQPAAAQSPAPLQANSCSPARLTQRKHNFVSKTHTCSRKGTRCPVPPSSDTASQPPRCAPSRPTGACCPSHRTPLAEPSDQKVCVTTCVMFVTMLARRLSDNGLTVNHANAQLRRLRPHRLRRIPSRISEESLSGDLRHRAENPPQSRSQASQ